MYEIPLSLQSPIMNQDQTSPSDVETHVVETFRLPAETVDALSKMNVNFEQVIAEVLKEQIKKAFESVDKNPLLTDKAREMAEDLIEDLKKSPNTSSYGVVCDSSNNTEESIDKGLLNVELGVVSENGQQSTVSKPALPLSCSHIATTIEPLKPSREMTMSTADTYVRARIDTSTKERAADALEAMGLSISDAIRLLMLRIADERRMPFDVKAPNATTRKAIAELEGLKQSWHVEVEEPMIIPADKPEQPSVLLPIIKSLNELKHLKILKGCNINTTQEVTDMSELLKDFDGVKATNQPFNFTLDSQKLQR
jgi:DNA-damage-inducible protein J